MLLVKKQGHGQVADLLFRILIGGNQVDGLEMSEVDVPAEDVYIQQLLGQVD